MIVTAGFTVKEVFDLKSRNVMALVGAGDGGNIRIGATLLDNSTGKSWVVKGIDLLCRPGGPPSGRISLLIDRTEHPPAPGTWLTSDE